VANKRPSAANNYRFQSSSLGVFRFPFSTRPLVSGSHLFRRSEFGRTGEEAYSLLYAMTKECHLKKQPVQAWFLVCSKETSGCDMRQLGIESKNKSNID
jgi:hypothetical protein